MKAWVGSLSLVAVSAWLGGCNRNCQNTCTRIYDECGVVIPGKPEAESLRECQDSCEDALQNAGTLEGYNPLGRDIGGEGAELQNDVQAAAWMDCVWTVDCEDIGPNGAGLCWPL